MARIAYLTALAGGHGNLASLRPPRRLFPVAGHLDAGAAIEPASVTQPAAQLASRRTARARPSLEQADQQSTGPDDRSQPRHDAAVRQAADGHSNSPAHAGANVAGPNGWMPDTDHGGRAARPEVTRPGSDAESAAVRARTEEPGLEGAGFEDPLAAGRQRSAARSEGNAAAILPAVGRSSGQPGSAEPTEPVAAPAAGFLRQHGAGRRLAAPAAPPASDAPADRTADHGEPARSTADDPRGGHRPTRPALAAAVGLPISPEEPEPSSSTVRSPSAPADQDAPYARHQLTSSLRPAPAKAPSPALSIGTIEVTLLPPADSQQASNSRRRSTTSPDRLSRGLGPRFGQGQA